MKTKNIGKGVGDKFSVKNVWRSLIFCLVIFGLIGVADAQIFTEAVGGPGLDFGRSVVQDSDGNFVITGPWSYSGGTYSDLSLIKVNRSGGLISASVLKGPSGNDLSETGNAVIEPSSTISTGVTVSESEPNNDHTTADPVELGDDYTGEISANIDIDYVSFFAKAGTILQATTEFDNSYLELFDVDGTTLIAHGTNYGQAGVPSKITFTILTDGTYYLAVKKPWDSWPASYTLEIRTKDLVVVGHSNSFSSGFNATIARFSSDGNTLRWAKILSPPGGATSFGLSVTEVSDGGFVMTGPIWNHPNGQGMDLFIAKFSNDGNFLWGNVVGGSGDDCGSSVIEANNQDLVVAGWTTSFDAMDLLLARFDANGALLWAKAYGGAGSESGWSVIEVNSDLFVTGATNSFGAGGDDLLLVKFDLNGNHIWTKTLGGPNDDRGHSLVFTFCGGNYPPMAPCGIAITGATESFGQGGQDLLVTMFDLHGNYQWARTLNAADPGTANDGGFSVIDACYEYNIAGWEVPMNCKLAFAGYTYSWGTGGEDILFGTFDYYGYTACEEIVDAIVGPATLPSPGSLGSLTTDLDANPITPVIQDITPTVTPVCTTDFWQYTDVGPIDQPVVFSVASITDIHLRYGNPPFDQLKTVVDRINEAINAGEDIRFVMVLGDIGDEGYRCTSDPYIEVKEVLDSLLVPYIPLPGNHDVWYDDNDGATPPDRTQSWFEKPQEEIFNQVFSPQYDYLDNVVLPGWTKAAPVPVSCQPQGCSASMDCYFQDFAFDYMRYHFISPDWNSRGEICTKDKTDLIRGFPDLQKWTGNGAWDWFKNHLENYYNMGDENVLIFAHKPLSPRASKQGGWPFYNFLTFNSDQYADIVNLLSLYASSVDKWFVGDWHVCDGVSLCCEENITDDVNNNVGSHVLTNIETRSVSSYPIPPGENIRLVRVHDALKLDFDYSPSQPTVNTLITFLDQSATTSGTITTWDWDFGDGTHSGIQNPTYRYTEPGIYKVTLTVETSTGLKGSFATAIDVGTTQLTSEYEDATAYNNARRLIYDNGVLHLIYRWSPADWEAGLTYANSTDNGQTWFEVTRSTLTGGDYPGGPLMGLYPALGVDTSGKPYIVKERTGGLGIPVFDAARREKPLGWFSYDHVIESGSFGHPSVVVDSEGTLHIAISYDDGTSRKIRYYKGHPGGLIRIDNILDYEVIPAAGSGECQFASIALDNSEVPHVIRQQGLEIYHSYRQGLNDWSNPEQISSGNAQTPSLVADGSVLHAVWQEGDKVVYKKYDGGWPTTPTNVSTLSAGTIESYPQVGSRDGLICVVWADIAGGNYEIFYSWTVTGSWSSPVNLSNTPAKSQYPQAAICSVSPNELCVVWTEGNGPTYDIRSKCF
uniref:3',5'-cyclic adenosine monophosphate phosphodiesterase CpdA n=1 Tax=Candidatus Methanophaga sp. ANME-1 ERB7 TaxID=2759913 RepID=A0A7G9ZCD0_9EURY|nr:3',5'-cyclic adenosine monophosphate phosphodiesterase CpdA [Methanosarcinales archaeon ANME-1 ERB7]